MNNNTYTREELVSALNSISVTSCSYQEWTDFGMALKAEGCDVSVWDSWSQGDSRYKHHECQRKWNTFTGNGITGLTILKRAREGGWIPSSFHKKNVALDWEEYIYTDEVYETDSTTTEMTACQMLKTYIETLFRPDEYVNYVTKSYDNGDGKFVPLGLGNSKKASQLIKELERYDKGNDSDLGFVISDWDHQAGAWIRFNATDGRGVKGENAISYRYALVESDEDSIEEQMMTYKQLNLPIAAIVNSGGKSLHAIVKVDAINKAEYSERVGFLFQYLESEGFKLDKQNKNVLRLSRLPGATRNGKIQKLEAVNIGASSWQEWYKTVSDSPLDNLPEIVCLADRHAKPLPIPEAVIEGVLRKGHKMLISGPSKAGKSFLLMELAISLASGSEWLGFKCRKSKILYLNLEIDQASADQRFFNIYDRMGASSESMSNIMLWHLRGMAAPLDELAPKIIENAKRSEVDVIIIDPIYKIITGDENNASEMGRFCNQFDRIADESGCSVIYCHHHSKGAQGAKKAIDRASGSGVFARDPDAIIDLTELEVIIQEQGTPLEETAEVNDNPCTAWEVSGSLREFASFKPVRMFFDYPIHRLDTEGKLKNAYAAGDTEGVLALGRERLKNNQEKKKELLLTAYNEIVADSPINGCTKQELAEAMELSIRTIERKVKESGNFVIDNSRIYSKEHWAMLKKCLKNAPHSDAEKELE